MADRRCSVPVTAREELAARIAAALEGTTPGPYALEEPSDEEVARWKTFAEDAFVSTNEDGAVLVGAFLSEDVESVEGATEDERAELLGEKPRAFGRIVGAEAVTRLWDCAVRAATERARKATP